MTYLSCLKLHNDISTKLKKMQKNDFEKDFFKLVNNAFFEKTIENMRKCRDIKLVATETRRNYLVLEPNYHTIIFFQKIY